ncbi:MAG: hypothetical protein M0R34_09605 [Candidatus Marinimicrobia bacterium]|nr:hypothetical protein [Candidatus Neomarinimicrobiota bacterium]MCK9560511.1 hypothetical protein [Candidatus Neomarinimicrobiota bacterium]
MKKNKGISVICNLKACGGKARRRWLDFLAMATQAGFSIDFHITEYHGHATVLTRERLAKGADRIIVFGGDGTLNEALNGMIEKDRPINPDLRLVYLTAGSSCDVAKMFSNPQTLLQRISDGQDYLVDVGKVECLNARAEKVTRYFLANSSIGVISRSIEKFNQNRAIMNLLKRINIDLAAVSAGIKTVLQFENMDSRISFENCPFATRKIKNITVFKCPYFGGGMNYGVATNYNDHHLHVATIDAMDAIHTFQMIPLLYSGTILKSPQAEYHRVQSLSFNVPGQNVPIETDGEIIGFPPCRYTILPELIHLVV